MGTKKETFLIIMKIISVEVHIKQPIEKMSIEWKRGDKLSTTKNEFALSPEKPLALVNETFTKSSIFYLINKTGKYFKKIATIRVKGFHQGREKIIGELDLDISQFVGIQNESKSLQLQKALPNSMINLQISIMPDDGSSSGPDKNSINDCSSEEDALDTSSKPIANGAQLNRAKTEIVNSGSSESHNKEEQKADIRKIAVPDERDSQIEILLQENDKLRDQVKDLEFKNDQLKSAVDTKDKQYTHLKAMFEEQENQTKNAQNKGVQENELYEQNKTFRNKVLLQEQELYELRLKVEELTQQNAKLKEAEEVGHYMLSIQKELETEKRKATLKEQSSEVFRKKVEQMAEELDQKDIKILELVEKVEALKKELETAKQSDYLEFDSETLSVLTTLGIDFLVGFLIFLGWFLVRKLRGEKKADKKEDLHSEQEQFLFDDHIDDTKLEKLLEDEQEQQRRVSDKQDWRESHRDTTLDDLYKSSPEKVRQEESDEEEKKDDEGDRAQLHAVQLTDTDIDLKERLLKEEESDTEQRSDENVGVEANLDTQEQEEQEEKQVEKERKQNLKSQIITKFNIIKTALKFNRNKDKPSGILDWLKILRSIDDEDLKVPIEVNNFWIQSITGTDTALYLVFIRMSAKFFAIITLINFIIFIPIYATGSPLNESDVEDSNENVSYIKLLTVLNVTGVPAKMISVYVIMNLFYTGAALVLMFYYWQKSMDWRYKKHSHSAPFKDHDIALHSIIVKNLPTTIPVQKMSSILKHIFNKVFPDSKVVSARAILKLDDLFEKATQLKTYKKNYRYYKKQNDEDTTGKKKEIKVRKGCFRGAIKYDAEDYYRDKIIHKSREIAESKRKLQKYNGGLGFVTFQSNLQVKKCIYKNEFRRLVMQQLTSQERLDSMALQWEIKQAPSQSDIIWENIYLNDGKQEVRSWFLLALLFIVCVVIVTPVTVLDNLQKIVDAITKGIGENNFLSIMLQSYASTLMLLALNSGIVPLFIDFIAYLEGHKTKSGKQLGIMRKNFFFQLFNTILLTLTAQSSILAFIQIFEEHQSWSDLAKELSKNLVNLFFLRYAIQLAFISNGIQLLDIPHTLVKGMKYLMYKRSIRMEVNPKPFVDDFAFDLGYYQSQAIVCFALGIIFTGTIPFVSLFIFLFFAIKYYIDKYNLVFAYNKEFEGGGVIKKQVIPFMIFTIYIFQILNLGYFSVQDDTYFKGGLIFIVVETIALLCLNIHYSNKKKKAREQLSNMEDAPECVNLEQIEENKSEEAEDAVEDESKKKGKIMKFIDGNLMKGTERRLTVARSTQMSKDNIDKLKQAYKHPFDRIPADYFQAQRNTSINNQRGK